MIWLLLSAISIILLVFIWYQFNNNNFRLISLHRCLHLFGSHFHCYKGIVLDERCNEILALDLSWSCCCLLLLIICDDAVVWEYISAEDRATFHDDQMDWCFVSLSKSYTFPLCLPSCYCIPLLPMRIFIHTHRIYNITRPEYFWMNNFCKWSKFNYNHLY